MSFNWAEYMSLAEALCGMPVTGPAAGTEARQRAGVSRAYYAGYSLARNRLRDVDGIRIPGTGNPHRFVAERYQNGPDTHRIRIGIELGRLRVARNRCDYEDDVSELPGLMHRSLAQAARILTELQQL